METLGPQFNIFHGTSHFFGPDEIIKPGETHDKVAWATYDLDTAKKYAGKKAQEQGMLFGPVYRVQPVDPDENLRTREYGFSRTPRSKIGFVPHEIVSWGMNPDV